MMKLIALYKQPEDTQSFDRHYNDVHTPLVKNMPGLEKLEITRMIGTPMGTVSEYYLMAEMYFASQEILQSSMASPEGRAAAKDIMSFAGKLVSMTIGEVVEG